MSDYLSREPSQNSSTLCPAQPLTMTGSSPHGSTIINGVHLSDTYAELGTRVFNLVLNSQHLSIRLAK